MNPVTTYRVKNDPPIKGSGNLLFWNKFLTLKTRARLSFGQFSFPPQSTAVQPRPEQNRPRNRSGANKERTTTTKPHQKHPSKCKLLEYQQQSQRNKRRENPERLRPDSRGNFQHPISLVRGSGRTRTRNKIHPSKSQRVRGGWTADVGASVLHESPFLMVYHADSRTSLARSTMAKGVGMRARGKIATPIVESEP